VQLTVSSLFAELPNIADDGQNAQPAIRESAQGIRKSESKGQEGLSLLM
jgi:hypothetical protein